MIETGNNLQLIHPEIIHFHYISWFSSSYAGILLSHRIITSTSDNEKNQNI